MKKIIIIPLLQILLFANVSAQTATRPKVLTPEEYIQMFKDAAIKIMHITGVSAAITLAQGLLESANGNSDLAIKANNHFGIKVSHGWSGPYKIKKGSKYRSYDSAMESYVDHGKFLKDNNHYARLFSFDVDDYKSWALWLYKLGYAEDRKYPPKLIKMVEKFHLTDYNHQKDPIICDTATQCIETVTANTVKKIR